MNFKWNLGSNVRYWSIWTEAEV